MKRNVLMGLAVPVLLALALFAIGGAAGAGQAAARPCCVSGDYAGHRSDTASPTCPLPKSEDFTLKILQEARCGSNIWGQIAGAGDPDHPQSFTGTAKPNVRPDCCEISGKFVTAEETIEFKALLCYKMGRYSGDGTYKQMRGRSVCNGTLTLKQK